MTSPRCLWQNSNVGSDQQQERSAETVDDLLARFSSTPPPRPLWDLVRGSLVVGQEFALTCLLLTRHRAAMQIEDNHQWQQVASIIVLPLILILLFGEQTSTPAKRACDALLLAGMLRLVSSVLRTLTASYSSDTVYALAIAGMMVHLVSCDYRYANGHSSKKKAIVSLNASLFSTTLLASRLSSNATVYVFVSTSVILFAFYPAARHSIAVTQSHASLGTSRACPFPFYHLLTRSNIIPETVFLVINVMVSVATWRLLETMQEQILFAGILLAICVIAPCWEYAVLQHYKVLLSGPWDIAHIAQEESS